MVILDIKLNLIILIKNLFWNCILITTIASHLYQYFKYNLVFNYFHLIYHNITDFSK